MDRLPPLPLAIVGLVGLGLIAGAGAARAQPPGPLAMERGDLDGDGKTDEIRVGRDGQTTILMAGEKRRTIPFRFVVISGLKAATISIDATPGKSPSVLVIGTGADRSEALWIHVKRRRPTLTWQGTLGLYDADTKTAREVAVIDGTLYRYFKNPAIERCDGKPAMLETEVFDPQNKLQAGSPPSFIEVSAPTLVATDKPPARVIEPLVMPYTFLGARVSSSVGVSSPDLLGDRGVATTWTEDRPTSGAGEFLTTTSKADDPRVAMLRLEPGSGQISAGGRPARIGLSFESGHQFWVELPKTAAATPVWIELPAAIPSKCVTVILDRVHPGGQRVATSITGLAILTQLDLSPGGVEAELVKQVSDGGMQARGASRQLMERPVEAVLAALLPRLSDPATSQTSRLRLRRVLAIFRREPAEIAAGVSQREANEHDREDLIRALVALGPTGARHLAEVAADRNASLEAREQCVVALTAMKQREPLRASIELAATLARQGGERELRRALGVGLGMRRGAHLDDLIKAARAADDATAPDLWRAVGVYASNQKNLPAAAADALIEALRGSSGYELRYRLLAALGKLPHPGAIAAVASALDARRAETSSVEVALRRVGTLALARNRDVSATEKGMLAATRDADVEVRLEAVDALGGHQGDGGSDERLGQLLDADRWPQVRRAAAAALAPRCVRPLARELLRKSARVERDIRVGTVVLAAIVDCGGADLVEFLIRLSKTTSRPTALRAEAIKQVAVAARESKDRSVTPTLAAMFEKFVSESFSDERALVLAQATARALCRVDDPRAVKPLLDAALDSAFTEIQASAVRSLGCYCTAETAPVLRDLSASSNVAVAIAARGASKQCKKRR